MNENKEFEQLLNITDPKQFREIAAETVLMLEKQLSDDEYLMAFAQGLKAEGTSPKEQFEKMLEERDEYFKQIDELLDDEDKRNFMKDIYAVTMNALGRVDPLLVGIGIAIEVLDNDVKIPSYAHDGDAGMDVYANEEVTLAPGETKIVKTGFKVAIPYGYELQVRPRSGLSAKSGLRVANAPGTIDSGFRGEVGIIMTNINPKVKDVDTDGDLSLGSLTFGGDETIGKGERIAQLVLQKVPKAYFYPVESVDHFGEDRGGGFGSTGK